MTQRTRACLSGLLAILLLALPAGSQEPGEPKFHFDTGNPPWKGERIPLPPGFAPDLGWKGVEQIRFAPGMFQPDAPDFFSYIIVFLLEPDSAVTKEAIQKEHLVYYQGLAKAAMGSKGATVDTSQFSMELEDAEDLAPTPESAEKPASYRGVLQWTEPFATQKPQTLHFEITTWTYEGKAVVLSCVSPVDPEKEDPWKTLREIRRSFRFSK